uniref:Uncharacterized protein n=1 Tax=mine drainage metagenome TaxID=410659 RepID=E6PTE4_9ZZZZ
MTLLNSLTTNSRTVTRNEYGGLQIQTYLSAGENTALRALLSRAVNADLLPEPYVERSKREFESLNHHIYDVLVAEESVIAVVVLALSYWKDLRKERTRIQKTYFLIQCACDDGVKVTELDGRTCAKRAKNAPALGQLTRHYLGLEPVKCATPYVETRIGYKVVAKTPDGTLVSAFDGSIYKPEVWRSEAAQDDHGGGFYYYESEGLARETTRQGVTFARCVSEGKTLVLCAVEVAGRVVEYDSGKRAASRLRILHEIGQVAIDDE